MRGSYKGGSRSSSKCDSNAAAEAVLEEPGRPGEPVVIEPDEGESKSHDKDAYAAFKEAIEVKDHEASYLEAF